MDRQQILLAKTLNAAQTPLDVSTFGSSGFAVGKIIGTTC